MRVSSALRPSQWIMNGSGILDHPHVRSDDSPWCVVVASASEAKGPRWRLDCRRPQAPTRMHGINHTAVSRGRCL